MEDKENSSKIHKTCYLTLITQLMILSSLIYVNILYKVIKEANNVMISHDDYSIALLFSHYLLYYRHYIFSHYTFSLRLQSFCQRNSRIFGRLSLKYDS